MNCIIKMNILNQSNNALKCAFNHFFISKEERIPNFLMLSPVFLIIFVLKYILLNTKLASITRLDNKDMKFFKKYSIIAQCKALKERISEWAYFLNLDKWFQRYSLCSAPKKGGFVDKN